MAPTPITTNTIGSAAATGTTGNGTAQTGLGKDDFLKLLMSQMSNMDPMSQSNQDPSQSIQQLTQYSMLEQLTNLNTAAESNKMAAAHSQAIALIGHEVSYLPTGATSPVTGTVKSAQVGDDGYPTLTIDSTAGVALGSLVQVGGAPATPATPAAPSGAETAGTT
jgi:flagellar basal-body rod modification protein FlgD